MSVAVLHILDMEKETSLLSMRTQCHTPVHCLSVLVKT